MLQRINAHYINGSWRTVAAPEWFTLINPTTEEAVSCVARADAAMVNEAVAAAYHAQDSWGRLEFTERAEYLQSMADYLQAHAEELTQAITDELGCPLWFSKMVQVDDPIDALAKHVGYARALEREQQWDARLKVRKEPVGVCGLITPWNYPLHQLIAKVAPALLAGCTLIVKPAEQTPRSALLLAMAAEAAGVPAGVFNLVLGCGAEIGDILCQHPDVDCISFTGSTRVGRLIQRNCADTVKRVCLELGGKSAFIIGQTERLADAVKLGVEDVMMNSGQTCVALTRMLVPADRYQEACDLAADVAKQLVVGDPKAEDTFLGPVVNQQQYQSILQYIESGIEDGARLIAGGGERPAGLSQGYYIAPTIFADVHNDMRIAREEIFGPVLCMIPYSDEDEALRLANDSPYGLSGRVWADDADERQRLAVGIRAGLIFTNAAEWHNAAPFGGFKQSGYGRELGLAGVEEFLELKSIVHEEAAHD
ncbi:aldehyde dehydrogenase family protein [Alkalimonas collagenimarina]|uniref:Aldehyde dehydrogenase family protein n=1 Tax=Alkalimonas collagenimarina TaxID=400390 RepID=A0ABT9H014_9GAMM|nr:aldehyde dehydrogenase family protein [Alkalimonas collagenimarina]MDP4536659.1 aldehyde dehydrogenase family protein [Alkalimonas collagenimarina]